MSFNYTPRPEAVVEAGKIATYFIWSATFFVPRVKHAALVGGLGAGAVAFRVTVDAKGDLGGLSHLIDPVYYFVVGAAVGAGLSWASKYFWRFWEWLIGSENVTPVRADHGEL
jgi:hypothetical protein